MGAIQIYEQATGQVTPMERFQGDLANAMPVYKDGDRYQPIKAELVATFLNQMEAYRQGAIALESFQRTQQYVLENSQKAHAESLAIVERMSDRALTSNEGTIAQLTTTIQTMANAMATKAAGANVRVEVKTTSSDRYQPIKAELVPTFLNQMEAYRQGAIALESFQRTQQYVLENSQKAHAESLAIVERISDRALTSNEGTIAQLTTTIQTMANAMATKSAGANVRVEVKTTGSDRYSDRYMDVEWLAWGVLFASIVGMTLVITANIFQGSRPQYQPQSALPQVEVRSI